MAKKTTPPDKSEKKKRARIIANSMFPEFRTEYERTKDQYAKYYPGGVDFIEARGYNELEQAFGGLKSDEDLIMMAHSNKDAMYGVPVSDTEMQTLDAPKGKTLATLFSGLQDRGYNGNCYLGICHGEDTAKDIQSQGVNIPMFATTTMNKWVGANPGNKKSFEDFFFGVEGGNNESFGTSIQPKIGDDYDMFISDRQQELMNRRASGTPLTEIKPLDNMNNGGTIHIKPSKKGTFTAAAKKHGKGVQEFANQVMANRENYSPAMVKKANFARNASKWKHEDGGNLPEYDLGGIIEKLGGASGIANTASGLIEGFQMLKQDNQNQDKAEQLLMLSEIVGQAASIAPEKNRRRYVRPEDMLIQPDQLASSHGTGTNFLAKNGKKLPSYEPGGWITDLIGEGNEGTAGSMLGSLIGGGKGQVSGAGKIGSTIGGVAGSFLGPVGGIAGSAIGGVIGGVIGGDKQKQAEEERQKAYRTLQGAAFQQGTSALRSQYSGFMKDGGKLPSYNLGGELQVYKGDAETISQNPYLPDSGETVMFKGPSHEDGGMPIKFGKTPVEVEGGEPAVKLPDGKKNNLTIFGDMKIPSYGVSELGDINAKGKKFKNYINDLSKIEDKQNKIAQKGLDIVNENPMATSFDKLKFNSGKAMLEGSNMKMKEIAEKKKIAASIQNAILETANELGLESTDLAKGSIKKAKKGIKVKNDETGGPFAHQSNTEIRDDGFADNVVPQTEKFDWSTVFNSVLPHLRPSNQTPLDPNQLSGEMFALASNQLEPVQAQTYSPLLESVSDISLQDQLNANQSDFNSLKRMTANNPAAQATLAAQKYAANSNVLGEQFRLNQTNKMNTYNKNRGILNDATLRNLAILDQQYVRQSQAKGATKATAQAALSSIADKLAKNKLENRTLGIYENLYNYRFGNKGYAWNLNPLAQFNTDASNLPTVDATGKEITRESTVTTSRDRMGIPTGTKETSKQKEKTENRNGGIVRALKSL